jgi:hypothetical protein
MTRTSHSLVIVLVFVAGATGCVRRDGINSDCRWPGEIPHNPVSAHHLSADAELAEDLAIRYADAHFGLHSPNPSESYPDERDQCMARLFGKIANEHGVPVEQVSGSLAQNRAYVDMAELLPFALLYSLTAILGARRIWRRYEPAEVGWASGITMALFVSLGFASTSALLGEVWNWVVEGHRIGNPHMSYLADRLFWHNHRIELFVAALLIFWLAAIVAACRGHLVRSAER